MKQIQISITTVAVVGAFLLSGCQTHQSSSLSPGMEASMVKDKFGPPVRVEKNADGSEEWFYKTENRSTTRSSFTGVESYAEPEYVSGIGYVGGGPETSSGTSVETKITYEEQSISISEDGKVEAIPRGKVVKNR